jgi:hypothetical protein
MCALGGAMPRRCCCSCHPSGRSSAEHPWTALGCLPAATVQGYVADRGKLMGAPSYNKQYGASCYVPRAS